MKTRMWTQRCRVVILQAIAWAICALVPVSSRAAATLRPPSVPLVACDPYFSIWSPADKLTDADTVHWTGKPHRLTSLVRIDGKGFRLMGKEPAAVPALPQTGLEALPTRTIYTFEGEGVRLTLTFMTAALPDDLMIYSRPVTYLTWETRSIDGKKHDVSVYFDASAELTVNEGEQEAKGSGFVGSWAKEGDARIVGLGSQEQSILAKKGDDLRIDWGHLYLAMRTTPGAYVAVWDRSNAHGLMAKGQFPDIPTEQKLESGAANTLAALCTVPMGKVGAKPVSRWLMLAYDDEYSIQYFKNFVGDYEAVRIKTKARELLKPGKHLLVVHCKQTRGGQYIDAGLADVQVSD